MTATIAAIATPNGPGGVGIVRISGPKAVEIAGRLVGRQSDRLSDRRFVLGLARDPRTGARIDEVLVVAMRAPRTFTGEDVAEIHGHGGVANMARLLEAAVVCGCRVAKPGEFTRRAFENGRIDLTQAEAIAGVIGAASERALRVAQAQLSGQLGRRIASFRDETIGILSEVEASIDFLDEDLDLLPASGVAARARETAARVSSLIGTYKVGRALREGIEVAFIGRPNVGKSSLLNALVGEERALVASEPGTTRDYLEAKVVWDGVPVTLIDTAGERDAATETERKGVTLGKARAQRADVVVLLRDAGTESAFVEQDDGGSRLMVVWNKIDIGVPPRGATGVSAVTGKGIDAFKAEILARAIGGDLGIDEVVTSERQRELLERARMALERAAEAAEKGMPEEVVAMDLREALRVLGEVTGEETGERVLDAVFARFCVGK